MLSCVWLCTGKISLYNKVFNHAGVSLVVENKHTKPLEYTLDCSNCKRVSSHRGTMVHKEVIAPGL